MKLKINFNHLRIGKGLLSLLALFMMLLAPQGAWAEDYHLTVGGVDVTSENASDITGDNITGTVNYNPESHTLTLYEATINGCIVSNSGDDLIVQLSGTNTINTTGVAFQQSVTTSPSPRLTFTESYGGVLLTNVSSMDMLSSGFSGPIIPDNYKITTDASNKLCIGEYFGVKLYGQFDTGDSYRYVTGANCNKLVTSKNSNNQEVIHASYDRYDKKLTLDNLNEDIVRGCKIANGSSYFVESDNDELNIYLVGENTFKLYSDNNGTYNVFFAKCTNINFTTGVTPGSLKITNENTYTTEVSPFDGVVTYSNHLGYSNEDITGGSGKYHYVQFQGIGLTVAGIDVTADNASHILGGDNETVTFDTTNKILTLNNASFTGTIQWASTETLTVKILGNSSIDATTNHLPVFEGNVNANLVFTSGNTTPGSLLLTSCYHNKNVLSGWKNGSSVFYNKGVSSGDAYDFDWWAKGISDQTQILFNNKYDLWVNGLHICDAQNEQYFDVDNEQSDYFYFDGSNNTLTFNNMAVNTTQDPFIKNGLSSLTIKLLGTNTVGCETLFLTNNGGQTNNNITFTADKEISGSLVITTTRGKDDDWYTGHNAPTVTGLVFTDEMKNSVRTLTFSEPTSYDLEVGGVQVTNANASNITGTGFSGNISYDATSNTLTLDGATIIPIQGTPGISYSGTAELKIKLIGENSIQTQGECAAIRCETPADVKPSLKVECGSLTCSLGLSAEEISPISGFSSILGVNGINEIIGNFLMLESEAHVSYSEGDGLYTEGAQENETVSSVTITSGYGITVAGELVHEDNADNVLNDDEQSVKFVAEKHTLKLNGATIGSATVSGNINVSSYVGELTIEINGENIINGYVSGGHQKLNIVMAEGAESPSLTINDNELDPIFGFSEISLGDGLYLNPYKLYGEEYVALPNVYYDGLQYNDPTGNMIAKVEFSTTKPDASEPSIWIGDKEVSSNGTFDGIDGASFDSEWNTLTLTDVKIGDAGGDFKNIVSSLPNLIINLVNVESEQNELAGRIISFNSSATLNFKGNGRLFINNTNPISGFSGTPTYEDALVYKKYEQYAEVKTLYAPFIYMREDNNVVFSSEDFGMYDADKFPGVTIKYTISYPSEEEDPEEFEYDYYSEDGVSFEGPCTITAYVAYQGKQSATIKGKYFGPANDKQRIAYGSDPVELDIVPAIEEGDGIKIIIDIEDNEDDYVRYDAETMKVTTKQMGSDRFPVSFGYTAEEFTDGNTYILNDKIFEMNVDIVPPAPTISLASGTYLSPHDPITITGTGLDNTTIKYKWSGMAQNYTKAIDILDGTLTAWEEYTPAEGGDVLASDEATATYTLEYALDVAFVGTNRWATYYSTDQLIVPSGLTVYAVKGVNETSGVVSVENINYIPAYQAVLINRAENAAASGYITTGYSGSEAYIFPILGGTSSEKTVESILDGYVSGATVYVLYNDAFVKTTSGTIPAHRGYLVFGESEMSQQPQAPKLTIDLGGNATGVNGVITKKAEVVGDIYDLQGRKVQKLSKKGLYISNGRKVVVNK